MQLSVITPSFRQVGYLACCARSVADQTGSFDLEHIIQDGGTGPEFERWKDSQEFADAISEPDDGMYDAINRGFARAKGDVLSWLNCDEQYLPGALEKVARWFEANPDRDILFGSIVLTNSAGHLLAYRQPVIPLRGHIQSCFLPTFSAATFIRRKIIDAGHLLDTRFRTISDAVWIDELLGAGYRPGLINEPLATFTQTGENLGQTPAAAGEGTKWRIERGMDKKYQVAYWSGLHRLRKFLAGCYRPKHIEIEIHLPGESRRVTRSGKVNGFWISEASSGSGK